MINTINDRAVAMGVDPTLANQMVVKALGDIALRNNDVSVLDILKSESRQSDSRRSPLGAERDSGRDARHLRPEAAGSDSSRARAEGSERPCSEDADGPA
jgi:hypothetical protein